MKFRLLAALMLLALSVFPAAAREEYTSEMDFSFSDREKSGAYSERNACFITGLGDSLLFDGKGISLTDRELTISQEGTYIFTGRLQDFTIVIAAGDEDKVQLVLNNAEISNSRGPALYIRSADKVFITLPEGTENILSDGSAYSLTDNESTLDAAIFSKADLCINGSGQMAVTGNYRHGIVSKDDLVIVSSALSITARENGLEGKDCVKISGADITIQAGADGIQSDNAAESHRGFIYLTGCSLNITAGNDGIQAETLLKTENTCLSILSGGGSSQPLGRSLDSFKGLKAGGDMILSGGEYAIQSRDDCIHANGSITIEGGTFYLASGDDGVHADGDLTVSRGDIHIAQSYEGMEASALRISGGSIRITASDDGLNGAGGSDGSGMGNRWGRGRFSRSTGSIEISGGHILIQARGDGVDSNGNITLSGGVVLVSGAPSTGNNAFDFDGEAAVTGGVMMALGSSGMARNVSRAENQGAMLVTFASQQAGIPLALCDEEGTAILSFTPAYSYQCAVITAPEIREGGTYNLIAGADIPDADQDGFARNAPCTGGNILARITLDSLLYQNGNGRGGGWKNFRGPGGR